jgi:ribosome biogenesis protein NSA2
MRKRERKKGWEAHEHSKKAKLYHKTAPCPKNTSEKKLLRCMKRETPSRERDDGKTPQGAVPACLLDREGQSRAEVLPNRIKQKQKGKVGKWKVPLPKFVPKEKQKY